MVRITRLFPIVFTLSLLLGIATLAACGSDDDDSDTDDPDDGDDDDSDDDSGDDDDDDVEPPGPYDDMAGSGKTVGEILGIASHMSTADDGDRDRVFEIEQCLAAGVHLSRRGFYWKSIEPSDDAWQFDGYDAMVGLLDDAGLSPMAMLTRGVSWAMPDGTPSSIDPAVFADFTGTVAARYADRIDHYEIWNEQNTERFWSGGQDPDRYGLLLQAAHEAIHNEDPDAEVIFGGMSSLDENFLDPRGIWNFLIRVGEAHPDLCDFMDGVAFHPYTFLQQTRPEVTIDLDVFRYPSLPESIAGIRTILTDLGCADLPLHLTEAGWPSLLIGDDRQAAFLARGVLLSAQAGVAGFYWYTFFDETPDSDIPTEDYFGLFQLPDGETDPDPKPSFLAMAGLGGVLGESRYAGDLGAVLGWPVKRYGLVFVDDAGQTTVALWYAGDKIAEGETITVPLTEDAAGDWTLYDQDANVVTTGDAAAGSVTLPINGEVVYLRVPVSAR